MGSKVLNALVAPLAKPVGKLINAVPGGNIIASAIATATGNPELIPLINGTSTYAKTGNVGSGLLSAGGSYLGGQLGSAFGGGTTIGQGLGSAANSVGLDGALNSGLAGVLGSGGGQLATNVLQGSLGGALGSYAGNSLGGSLGESLKSPTDTTGFQAYRPQQQGQEDLPASLSGFGGLDPAQQQTNIANKGVYGGGLGADENQYFLNLVNRQLVDKSGGVQGQQNLSPITSSYLQQLGLGGYGNSNDLLQAISNWHS